MSQTLVLELEIVVQYLYLLLTIKLGQFTKFAAWLWAKLRKGRELDQKSLFFQVAPKNRFILVA